MRTWSCQKRRVEKTGRRLATGLGLRLGGNGMNETTRKAIVLFLLLSLFIAPALAAPGDYKELGDGDWSKSTLMTAMDGFLWVIDYGTLYKVDKNGKWTEVGSDDWSKTTQLCAMDGFLYAIDDGSLYKVEKTGKYAELGDDDWSNATLMTALDGFLYIIDDGTLYSVSVK